MQFGGNQKFSKQQNHKTFLTWINDLIIQFFWFSRTIRNLHFSLSNTFSNFVLSISMLVKGGPIYIYIYADTVPLNKMSFAHIYHSISFYCVGVCLRLTK